MIYQARDLAMLPGEELWALLDTPNSIKVQMDDGVVETRGRRTLISVYCWPFYKHFPKTPALMQHHIRDDPFDSKTMESLLCKVHWACWDAYDGKLDKEFLAKILGEARNRIYNDLTYKTEAYAQPLSAMDFISVITYPEIKAINAAIEPNHKSIDSAHRRVSKILHDPTKLPGNRIAKGCKLGIFKIGQVLQCVSARGYLTDYDNNIFRKPILRGFAHGLRSFEDLIKESRSATKALANTEEPLQKTQYFNRKLQILTDTITDLIPGDCGSKRYLQWFVAPEDVDDLDGMNYVHNGVVRRFDAKTARSEGLIGQVLNFRAVFYCDSMHPRGFCETCYGAMSHPIPRGTNPGHVASTKLGERITQNVLSTKHHDHNASSNMLEISMENQRYIKFVEDRNTIVLSDQMEGKHITITLDANEAGRLADVLYVPDVSLLQASLVSSITRVQFNIKNKQGADESIIVPVYSGKRTASISKELMQYAKDNRWELTSNGNYSIDLKYWDQDLPLFTLPLKNANMLDYMKTIEAFFTGAKSSVSSKTIRQCKTPDEALRELHAIISTQLRINLAYLQMMVFACMVRSPDNYDYRLPLPGNTPTFSKFATLVAGRSVSAVLAYQNQRTTFTEPQSFLIEHRPGHPLDQMLE